MLDRADCADFGCHNSIRIETKHFLNTLALTFISFPGRFVFAMQKHYLFFFASDPLVNHFHRGPGIWKFNCELLKSPEYISIINRAIMEFRLKYALPVYNIEYIKHASDLELQFSVTDDILLEMLILNLRDVTIKYSKLSNGKEIQEKMS